MFYVYHIKGKKWGCCNNRLENRLRDQGYSIKDVDRVIIVGNLQKASQMERDLQVEYGYPLDTNTYEQLFKKVLTPYVKQKAKNTLIKKYGSISGPLNTPEVKAKIIAKQGNMTAHMNTPEIRAKKSKQVIQLTLEGIIVKEWPSQSFASRELKIPQADISFCCNGKFKQAGGYVWKFKSSYFNNS
jgi:hypothetical protein